LTAISDVAAAVAAGERPKRNPGKTFSACLDPRRIRHANMMPASFWTDRQSGPWHLV